jgi:exodeoxyribonuclease-5
MDVTLTPHQQEALDWLVNAVLAKAAHDEPTLIALRGLAGTGKTTLIPALREAIEKECGMPVVVGSPTHRAAMILRRKGISEADTVHAHALIPYFKADYRRAAEWLGEALPVRLDDTETAHDDIDGFPYLIYNAVEPDLAKGRNLRRTGQRFKAAKLLRSVGISGKDHFAGFGPKEGEGVLIIDEASMVGAKMLALCQEAYEHIILIGDPGQLPPVKDEAQLATVEGTDLTEIHRQAGNSPIIQLAYKAREGARITAQELPTHDLSDIANDAVYTLPTALASAFLDAPLIVWRNATRIECTHAIRAALGFTKTHLTPGEPLVCRSTSQEDRAEGFYNNGLYRIAEVFPDDPRRCVVEDALGETSTIQLHMEELDGDMINPRAIPFRFGYCLTAHTAQGGEWPTVYISLLDYQKYAENCLRYGRSTELAQWAYTAITRAKNTLVFLTQHTFLSQEASTMAAPTKATPPSAPLLNNTPLKTAQDAPQDDIADPALPVGLADKLTPATAIAPPVATPDKFGEHEALLQGFAQHIRNIIMAEFRTYAQDASKSIDEMYTYTKKALDGDLEKVRRSESVLDKMAQGLQVRHDPYEASIQAMSPEGFVVTVGIKKSDPEALVENLPSLVAWLAESGYTAVRS